MTTAIVATAESGGAAAFAQVQPKAAAPAAITATAAEGRGTISATAQEAQQPIAVQARLLRNEGPSVPQIATQLKITASAVQSYLGAPAPATKD
jgi:hypothetical protein